MNANLNLKQVEGNLEHYAETADQRVAEFEEVLGRLVVRFESIMETVSRIVAKGREQVDNLLQMKDKAFDAVKPVVKATGTAAAKGKEGGQKLVTRYRQDPAPFLAGGALILGGVLITAYYLNRSSENEEISRAPLEDAPKEDEFTANAS